MARSNADVLKAKQKKQKVIAAVGAVILLGVLGFQVPKVMAKMHKKGPVYAAPTTTATAATPSLATPAAGGTGESVPGATAGGSEASLATAAAPVADGQLASFSRFSSKDPFLQQISDTAENDQERAAMASGGGSSSGSSSSTADTPSSAGTGTSGSTTSGSGSTNGSDTSAQPASDSAVISVNGTLMAVAVGKDFPQPSSSDPGAVALFRLVSVTESTAKVAIVGGSYTNGAPTVTLRVNKPVTLMNTADGTRYKLVLKPRGTAVTSHG